MFENHDTVLFQIQEMLRTERITAEAGILHELETYNELVPGERELSATMFVEIADKADRDRRLVELAGLERALSIDIGGLVVPAKEDPRGERTDRTTAVHYLKFPIGAEGKQRLVAAAQSGSTSVLYVVHHPKLEVRAPIPVEVLRALARDQTG